MSARSQLQEYRIMQMLGTSLKNCSINLRYFHIFTHLHFTSLHEMEKQPNKIRECPLAHGLFCMSNRATEIVMNNKSLCTLSGQKELIKHKVISMIHSESVCFCRIYTVCKSYLYDATPPTTFLALPYFL
jgi:hypothetical protein